MFLEETHVFHTDLVSCVSQSTWTGKSTVDRAKCNRPVRSVERNINKTFYLLSPNFYLCDIEPYSTGN